MGDSLRRDRGAALLGGVCAGIARRFDLPVAAVRAVAVVSAVAGGIPVVVYLIAWAALPATGERHNALAGRRATIEIAVGTGLLMLAALLLLRAWGLWVGDALVWPVTLVAVGAALIWRQSQGESEEVSPRGS